jgi:hypothetical protein
MHNTVSMLSCYTDLYYRAYKLFRKHFFMRVVILYTLQDFRTILIHMFIFYVINIKIRVRCTLKQLHSRRRKVNYAYIMKTCNVF